MSPGQNYFLLFGLFVCVFIIVLLPVITTESCNFEKYPDNGCRLGYVCRHEVQKCIKINDLTSRDNDNVLNCDNDGYCQAINSKFICQSNKCTCSHGYYYNEMKNICEPSSDQGDHYSLFNSFWFWLLSFLTLIIIFLMLYYHYHHKNYINNLRKTNLKNPRVINAIRNRIRREHVGRKNHQKEINTNDVQKDLLGVRS